MKQGATTIHSRAPPLPIAAAAVQCRCAVPPAGSAPVCCKVWPQRLRRLIAAWLSSPPAPLPCIPLQLVMGLCLGRLAACVHCTAAHSWSVGMSRQNHVPGLTLSVQSFEQPTVRCNSAVTLAKTLPVPACSMQHAVQHCCSQTASSTSSRTGNPVMHWLVACAALLLSQRLLGVACTSKRQSSVVEVAASHLVTPGSCQLQSTAAAVSGWMVSNSGGDRSGSDAGTCHLQRAWYIICKRKNSTMVRSARL